MAESLAEIELAKQIEGISKGVLAKLAERDAASGARVDAIDARLKVADEQIAVLKADKEAWHKALVPGVESVRKVGIKGGGFSLARALQLSYYGGKLPTDHPEAKRCGLELEVFNQSTRDLSSMPDVVRRTAINAATGSAGGLLVPTGIMETEIVPDLLAMNIGAKVGVRVFTGLSGEVTFVREGGGTTAYYVDSDLEESGTESVPTWKYTTIRPRYLGAFVPVTKSMMDQSAISIEKWATDEIVRRLNLRRDKSIFIGDPGIKEPRGIFNTSGINTKSWAGADYTGAGQTMTTLLQGMVGELWKDDAFGDVSELNWAVAPEFAIKVGATKDAQDRPIFLSGDQALLKNLLGIPLSASTQLTSATTTDQRGCVGAFKWCYEGLFSTLALASSDQTETNFRKLRTTIRGVMAHDVAVVQPEAFCIATLFDEAGA